MRIIRDNWEISLLFFITLFIYLLFSGRFHFYFPRTNRDYFSSLSRSFLAGKLDIDKPGFSPNDLSYFKNKYYLYWGPVPAIFLLPITFLFGENISDILYTAIFGTVNIFLIFLLLKEFSKYVNIKITKFRLYLLVICFAFGTIEFYLSILGTVWFTSQIVSEGVFITSLYFLFNYLNNKHNKFLYISIFFLGLAILGKYTFILSLPIYIGLVKRIRSFIILILFIISIFLYNYFRFGNIFETGLKYMQVNPIFTPLLVKNGYFNFNYIINNLYYLFINPIIPDPYGTSLFITSPIFLLVIYSFIKNYFIKNKYIFKLLFISAILVLLPILFYYGGGWYQFGYRYALDIYPLLFLLLTLIVNKFSIKLIVFLIFLSIVINIYGTLWMMDFAKYAFFHNAK